MTSTSEPLVLHERALDSMFIAYALLSGHPAADAVKKALREHAGWFVIPLSLLEAYHLLVRVYGAEPNRAAVRIRDFAEGPVSVVPLSGAEAIAALPLADSLGIDATDAIILHTCERLQARVVVTDDMKFAQAVLARGLVVENPVNTPLRKAVAQWESTHLPAKGLPRVLNSVGLWLAGQSQATADEFRSATGGYSHLP